MMDIRKMLRTGQLKVGGEGSVKIAGKTIRNDGRKHSKPVHPEMPSEKAKRAKRNKRARQARARNR